MSSSAKEYQAKRDRETRAFELATTPIDQELRLLLESMLDGHRYLVKNLIRVETARDFSSASERYYIDCLPEIDRLSLSRQESNQEGVAEATSPLARFRDSKSQWADMRPLSINDVTPESWETVDWAVDQRKWPQDKPKDHSAFNTLDKGSFTITTFGKKKPGQSKASPNDRRVTVPGKSIPIGEAVQKYTDYIILRNNILAEDDDNMRYVPYFGEDIDPAEHEDFQEELKEAFIDRTQKNEVDAKRAERAAQFCSFFEELLERAQLKPSDLKHYLLMKLPSDWSEDRKRMKHKALPPDFDHEQTIVVDCKRELALLPPPSEKVLERAEAVSQVFIKSTKLSVWDVLKKYGKDSAAPITMTPLKQAQSASSQNADQHPFALGTHYDLFCYFCGVHYCPWHDIKLDGKIVGGELPAINKSVAGADKTPRAPSRPHAAKKTTSKNHGSAPERPDIPVKEVPEEPLPEPAAVPSVTLQQKVTMAKIAVQCWEKDAPCSEKCFIKQSQEANIEGGESISGWTEDQVAMLNIASETFRYNSRCACLLACMIHRPCSEIHARLQRDGLLPDTPTEDLESVMTALENGTLNGVRPHGNNRKPTKTSYPADCEKSMDHKNRGNFKRCYHPGVPCSSKLKCDCVKNHIHCEKFCGCDLDCPRRWRGCNCANGKLCVKNKSCPCNNSNRECDPDLCRSCNAEKQLDPLYRMDEEVAETCCQNVALQKAEPKKTLLGKTVIPINGYGLFAGQDIKKESFLGEYKGEVISSYEAERRGKIYDKRKLSFLFDVNAAQVIDATRAGNKFRFVNHWAKKPNTYARVFIVNGVHRIAMFTRAAVAAGEELFFDYGYSNKSLRFVCEEPPEAKANPAKPAAKRKKTALDKITTKPASHLPSSFSIDEPVPNPRRNNSNKLGTVARHNSASTGAHQSDSEAEGSVARSARNRKDDDQDTISIGSDPSMDNHDDDYAIDNDDPADEDFGFQGKRLNKKRRVN